MTTLTFARTEQFNFTNLVIIELEMAEERLDPLTQLKIAITDWVENTEYGQDEWTNSSEDFNIGDLLNVDRSKIDPFMTKHGIVEFRIMMELSDNVISYDTILVEPT